ncbi:undecaprenyl-diphosphate phosphatase [Alteribacillus sp. HJP-4]|uniref:undecaprenyl-diphosphate phosphatase n=1 Tax=Alteribacillus sp. HJP-4 TaxID=2775394 RepID=UPI0035CD0BF7
MSFLEAVIFGVVQGIAEFLPISSTAHVIIAQMMLGYSIPGLSFEIFLHLGSVAAVILFYREDIIQLLTSFFRYISKKNPQDRTEFYFSIYIVIATIITGVLGIILEDVMAENLKTPSVIGGSLALTGLFLILIERFHTIGSRTEKDLTIVDSIIIGVAQALAVIPGLSRSGTTLIAGLYAGLNRDTAVRYSFLLSIPVILGSTVMAIGDVSAGSLASVGTGPLIGAMIASFVASYFGILLLINFLNKGRLIYFALYCFLLAAVVILFLNPAEVEL